LRDYYRAAPKALSLWAATRSRAKLAGIPFTLTADDFRRLFATGRCTYCLGETAAHRGRAKWDSASLDRVIPSRGYTLDNVVLACRGCNSKKNDLTPEDMRRFLRVMERFEWPAEMAVEA